MAVIEQLRIEVRDGERTDGDIESLLRNMDSLRADLLQLDVEDVARSAAGPAPPGSRSGALEQVNALLVTLTAVPALLHQVVTVVDKWRGHTADSGAPPTVSLTFGDRRLELSGGDPEEQRRMAALWLGACTTAERRRQDDG
ncbi:hypothetical protein ACGF1Z_10150 [Streptomyces sp. NPDC048018]|uniref:hypothetical protein n=1 Tax=Streptomyces sp. NPDC048018 TaxID=3365499 RepID=UPI0037134C1B